VVNPSWMRAAHKSVANGYPINPMPVRAKTIASPVKTRFRFFGDGRRRRI
jgi:hypothetical protein